MSARVENLTSALIPSAARLLASAFFENPLHVYLFPDPRSRSRRLVWMLSGNLRLQPDLSASFCICKGSSVDAMGFFTRLGAPGPGLLSQIRGGLLAAPVRLGLGGVRRAAEVTREIQRQVASVGSAQPVWYLNNMAVREELRGSGVGTELLAEQLHIRSTEEPGSAFALATQRPENVVFYRRQGFEVVSEERIGRGPNAFQNWIMRRAPGIHPKP